MDVMKMDERQRTCWLLANRALLFIVGIVWLGLIGHEFYLGNRPIFLIAMVPVFAILRFGFYKLYASKM